MNVRDIVEAHLKSKGYDGLYLTGECACELGDLMPCMEGNIPHCEPGYKGPCPDTCGDHDFHIGPDKAGTGCDGTHEPD